MTATVDHKPLRLSSVTNACPRKAVYEATGAPAREPTDREQRWRFRGQRIGQDYADLLAAKYGETAIERERKITWPLGVGHADIYLPHSRTVIEVLSSAHATGTSDQTRGKLLQLVGYIEHDPDAENGVLVILNPADFSEDRIVVAPESPRYAQLVEEMRGRVAEVLAWRDTGELPARVCSRPSEAMGRFCMHAEHCFDGWEPPALEEIEADETLIASVAEFEAARRAHAEAVRVAKSLEQLKRGAQQALEHAELPVGVEVKVGPFKVRRTWTERPASFDWRKAEMAGVFEPGLYGEFFKDGARYSTFKAERVQMSGDEFGDEAPWTDADLEGAA